ncbi:argininosuccinate synthase [Candidatus Roizmanbacteria bacterium]|nr:argininosuccinate synthase [Candidatus Roizmanbacteria bacterium]
MSKLPIKSKDFEENKKQKKSCILLYSGGVDTSICVYLLQKYYGYKVTTLSINVFQDKNWAQDMAKKAKQLGAEKTIVYEAKDIFANNYLSKVIKANAMYDDKYPLGTSMARPMQAKIAVEIAIKEGADAIAHGCKGRGADAFRLNMVFNYLLPKEMKLVMPINDWWPTRQEEVDFAYENNIPVPVPQDNPFSYDDNIMSNAINYGVIDNIEKSPPEEAFKWTVPVDEAPNKAETIEIEFQKGLPIKLNNKTMKLAELIQKLNIIGGKHGIGRIDMIENGLYGNKFRWVYEAPAAEILIDAHKEIERLVFPKESLYFKHYVIDKQWTKLAYHSFFYSPLSSALMSFIDIMEQYVHGKVKIKLFKGKAWIMSRKTDDSLTKLDPKDIVAKEVMDIIPYGFEEYSFASKHESVIADYLGELKI